MFEQVGVEDIVTYFPMDKWVGVVFVPLFKGIPQFFVFFKAGGVSQVVVEFFLVLRTTKVFGGFDKVLGPVVGAGVASGVKSVEFDDSFAEGIGFEIEEVGVDEAVVESRD